DKFGRGRVHVLASGIPNAHSVRVQQRFARDVARAKSVCSQSICSHLCVELPLNAFTCLCADDSTQLEDGSCAGTKVDELPLPKQCACQNGGICQLDGTCDCGDFEGEQCQKGSTVSREAMVRKFQLIGRFGSNAFLAALLFVSLFACVVLMVLIATNLYKKRLLLFKKNEAADGAVSFRGNVISFSNPVLDPKPVT
ncbi:unnamed protein product, partial [Gongylonema pulchrum]|uniref:EGF-like domain-containing protein n=1 Tax=Gongylonema pulchrum TaxID=637853 RepID=A0A183EXG8_9BILA